RQEKDLQRIDPSLTKTKEIEDMINANNKMAIEIRNAYNDILGKIKGNKSVSRGRSYNPIHLPVPVSDFQASSPDNNLTKLEVLNTNLNFLEEQIRESEKYMNSLLSDLRKYNYELDQTPTIWPVYG